MKVSIITIVYNGSQTIKDAIESVQGQDYDNIEYIVIDGNSTDGTQDIVRSYNGTISKFVSEADNGLYDALNKGIKTATGDVIGLLHADDVYHDTNVITKVVDAFTNHNVDSLYGDLVYVNRKNTSKVVRYWRSGKYQKRNFLKGWMPPHPTFFVKSNILDKYGFYDTELKQAADYELMLRLLYKYDISTFYVPEIFVRMRVGGISNNSLKSRINANREDYQAWVKNNLSPRFYTTFMKPFSKIGQYFYQFRSRNIL